MAPLRIMGALDNRPTMRQRKGGLPALKGRGLAIFRYDPMSYPVADCAQCHIVVLTYGKYADAATIRSLNPDVKILLYMHSTQAEPSPAFPGVADATTVSLVSHAAVDAHDAAFPSDPWQLRDSGGNPLAFPSFPTERLLDVGRASYRTKALAQARAIMAALPNIDGFFWDNINASYFQLTGNVAATAYPGSQAVAEPLWQTALEGFVAAVMGPLKNTDGAYMLPSAGRRGTLRDAAYEAYWTALAPHTDAFFIEYYVQSPVTVPTCGVQGVPHPNYNIDASCWTGTWDSWYDFPAFAESLGCGFVGAHKSAKIYAGGSVADDQLKMMYGRASFLLTAGVDDRSAFCWIPRSNSESPLNTRWTTDLGTPMESVTAVGVGWRRYWTRGVVLVNTSPDTPQTFTLDGTYVSLHDGLNYTSVTVQPSRAHILRRP